MTLDEAIKKHLETKRKYLQPLISEAIQRHTQLHIRIFEQIPRDSSMIESRIAMKEKAKDQSMDAIKTDELWTEIQALQRLLTMVRKHEVGESLDAYGWSYLLDPDSATLPQHRQNCTARFLEIVISNINLHSWQVKLTFL